MESSKPGAQRESERPPARPEPPADRSSPDAGGGALAVEEDIGTEGGGTEPVETSEPDAAPPGGARGA